MTTKRLGFTLAEVLITLGIIGVVAAMTIPTLIANTNSAKFKSQFKKSLATLNQAALMGTAQYELDYAGVTGSGCAADADPNVNSSICALFNGTLSGASYAAIGNLQIRKADGTSSTYPTPSALQGGATYAAPDTAYTLADGSLVLVNSTMSGCTKNVGASNPTGTGCYGFIDVNGTTLPNRLVKCSNGSSVNVNSSAGSCIVRNNATDMGDIFPVVFHDGVVEPATMAARYVMAQSK